MAKHRVRAWTVGEGRAELSAGDDAVTWSVVGEGWFARGRIDLRVPSFEAEGRRDVRVRPLRNAHRFPRVSTVEYLRPERWHFDPWADDGTEASSEDAIHRAFERVLAWSVGTERTRVASASWAEAGTALRAFARALRRAVRRGVSPSVAQAARALDVPDRWPFFRELKRGAPERLADAVHAVPGGVAFGLWLRTHADPALQAEGERLFDGLRAGKRLDPLLRDVLRGWSRVVLPTLPDPDRDRAVRDHRLLLRRVGLTVSKSDLGRPLPGPLVPEDLPADPREAEEWLGVLHRSLEDAAGVALGPAVRRGFHAFLMRHAVALSEIEPPAFMDDVPAAKWIANYLSLTGRVIGRANHPRTFVVRELRDWRWSHLDKDTRVPGPPPPDFDDHGLKIEWLQTIGDFRRESLRMRNCVVDFWPKASGARMFGHATVGRSDYTFQVEYRHDAWRLGPVVGFANDEADPDDFRTLERWVHADMQPERPARCGNEDGSSCTGGIDPAGDGDGMVA